MGQCALVDISVQNWVDPVCLAAQSGWISLVSGYSQPRFGLHDDVLSAVLGGAERFLPQMGGSRPGEGDQRFYGGKAVRREQAPRKGCGAVPALEVVRSRLAEVQARSSEMPRRG